MILTHKFAHIVNRFSNKYSQSSPQGRYNPWVIGWFALIGIFLSVNAVFVVFAVTSNPGLVVNDYYEQGRQYEKNAIKLLAAQQRLRWESKLEVPETITLNQADTYRFSVVDARGLPLNNADVQLQAYRPSNANADFTTTLQAIGPGLYQGSLSFPLPGIWDLNVKIRHGANELEIVRRLSVNEPAQ